METTKTVCPYCGVGCGLEVLPPAMPGKATNRDNQGNPIWKVRGDRSHPSSQGKVCLKGATVSEALDKSRLKYPMMRETLDEPFRRVTWEQAFRRIVNRIKTVLPRDQMQFVCMVLVSFKQKIIMLLKSCSKDVWELIILMLTLAYVCLQQYLDTFKV